MRVDLPEDYRPSEDETYMNPKQLEYFKQKLLSWREQVVEARPTATLSLEAQERHKQIERLTRARHRKGNPPKGGEVMRGYETDDLVGMYKEDGSVRCRDCMNEEDWRDLKEEDIIPSKDIEEGGEWICCDYCEKTSTRRRWERG